MSEQQIGIITGGFFLIGIAALGFSGMWWPGILVVIGCTVLLRGLLVREGWSTMSGGLWLIGIAAVFWFKLPWWLLLALTGLAMIVGGLDLFRRSSTWKRKRKNDDDMDTRPGEPRAV